MGLKVLTLTPNLIEYFRIVLIMIAGGLLSVSESKPTAKPTKEQTQSISCVWGLSVYGISVLLDLAGKFLARHLHQRSAFGAWLDFLTGIIGRTMLWHMANVKFLSWLIPSLEFVTFTCIHAQFGSLNFKARFDSSKISNRSAIPSFVQKVFANGFHSFHGIFILCGVQGLPIIVVAAKQLPLITPHSPVFVSLPTLFLLFVLSSGRTYASCCEAWFIVDHIRHLLTGPQQMISRSTITAIRRQSLNDFPELPLQTDDQIDEETEEKKD